MLGKRPPSEAKMERKRPRDTVRHPHPEKKGSGVALQGSVPKFCNKISNSRRPERYFVSQLQIFSPKYLLHKAGRSGKSATSTICPIIGRVDFVHLGGGLLS